MGLDTSHGCWHGAYSAFNTWRQTIAKAAGVPLNLMEGFYEPPGSDLIQRTMPRSEAWVRTTDGSRIATKVTVENALNDAISRGDGGQWEAWTANFRDSLPISWETLRSDPLWLLLHHSDCEGIIKSSDCLPIANSLEQLIPKLPDGGNGGHCWDYKQVTQRFIDGLKLAASRNEDVDFH